MKEWTSIYSAAAPLPPQVLRRLAHDAGVHLYTDRPDWLVFADRHYLLLGDPAAGGECNVSLPEARTVVDLASGALAAKGTSRFSVSHRPKEVRLFEMR